MHSDIAGCGAMERSGADAAQPSGADGGIGILECSPDSGRCSGDGDLARDSGGMGVIGQRWDELAYNAVVKWPEYLRFREQFIEILDPNLYTPEWLDMMVYTGQFYLFTSGESAILASIKVYPTGLKELQGEAAVGNLGEIARKTIPLAEDFGRSQGCSLAVIQSREGWSKVLKNYKTYQTCIRRAL